MIVVYVIKESLGGNSNLILGFLKLSLLFFFKIDLTVVNLTSPFF